MNTILLAEHRESANRSGLKRLREEGRLPGIIFGDKTDNAMIHISRREFQQWVKGGGAGVVHIKLGEQEVIPVLLEDVQRDAITQRYIHADFLRVSKDETARTKLPIVYVGTAIGTKKGGIVQTDGLFIEVEALPGLLPSSLTVDISKLDISDTLQAGDIELPEGVRLVSSANEYLVSVVAPKVEAAAEEEKAE